MASILFTLVPVILTFAVASMSPESEIRQSGKPDPCSNCPA
jgi:hypothetical protein